VTKPKNPGVTALGTDSDASNRQELVLATNPAGKVLQFSSGQRSDERPFADAFEHAPNGMALLDSDGRIVHASIALCRMLGFSESELLGFALSEITHPDDIETEAEQRKRLASGEIDRYQLVERLIREDEATTWVLLSVSACRRISGFPKYYVLQIESAGEHRWTANGAAPDALAHLLGEAVHEIGNTLTPLMVNTQLIVEQSTASEISDSAYVIFKAARRIAFTLRRLRGLKDLQSVAYVGEARMLDLRQVAPPGKAD
jgi:PAS domain S-box-containing protein